MSSLPFVKIGELLLDIASKLVDPKQYDIANMKHMKKAIDAGEKYILINEDGELDVKKRVKRLAYYKKRFFHFN